jgi:hypothetical protein
MLAIDFEAAEGNSNKVGRSGTGSFRPFVTRGIGYREKWFPTIGVAITYALRHLRLDGYHPIRYLGTPAGQHHSNALTFWKVESSAKRLNRFIRRAAAHLDNDGAGCNGVGEIADACQSHCAIGRNFFGLHLISNHDATASDGTASVSRIQQTPYLAGVLHLGAEQRIDFVIENRRATPILIPHLAKQVSGRHVDGMHWVRRQGLSDL